MHQKNRAIGPSVHELSIGEASFARTGIVSGLIVMSNGMRLAWFAAARVEKEDAAEVREW